MRNQRYFKGLGGIVVDDAGTIFAPAGRGIYAKEGPTGLGGILVTGTGDVIKGTSSSCCSGIKADIKNTADSSDVIVNWSGNVFDSSTLPYAVISGIHALTAGTGNVIVAGGSGATISDGGLFGMFGIAALAYGKGSTGDISASTGTNSTLSAGGTGIVA